MRSVHNVLNGIPCTMGLLFVKRRKEPKRRLRYAAVFTVTVCCALGAGCHKAKPASQDDEILNALNRFYAAQPACLWAKPTTLKPTKKDPDAISAKEARALDDAGLLDRERHGYVLTNAGRPFWREDKTREGYGNLCFGKWHVTRIDSVVPRHDDLLGTMAQTEFEATIPSPALWTRLPEVQKAFPLMTLKVTQQHPHSATMRHTDKGWDVAVIVVP